jgi:iron(III) transport system permease protein
MANRRDFNQKYGQAFSLVCLLLAAAVTWIGSDSPARRLLLNTFLQCGSVAAVSLPVGVLLALLLTRTNVHGKRLAWLLLLTLLFLPLHSTAAGWIAVFGKLSSQAPAFFQTTQPLVEGMPAVIWIHAMAAIPWVTVIVSLGLATIPQEVEEAAILDISPARFFLGVGLRYYLPFILAAGLFVIIAAAGEMTVTNLYVVPTYTEELYNNFMLTRDAYSAGTQNLPGICGAMLLAVAVCGMIASLLPAGFGQKFHAPRKYDLGTWRLPLTSICWLILLLVFGVPLVSLLWKAGLIKQAIGSEHWSLQAVIKMLFTMPYRFRREFGVSAHYAAWGAIAALLVGLPLAILARGGGMRRWPAIAAAAICWAIPGPLVGLGLIGLLNWNVAPLIFLYDKTPLAPSLAMGIKALPIVILILWTAFASIPRQTIEAAQLDGAGRLALVWRIMLPQRAGAIAAAAVIAFAIGLADLAWSLVVLRTDTVQRRVFGLLHAGVEEQVAGVSLVMLALYFVLAVMLQALFTRWTTARKPT